MDTASFCPLVAGPFPTGTGSGVTSSSKPGARGMTEAALGVGKKRPVSKPICSQIKSSFINPQPSPHSLGDISAEEGGLWGGWADPSPGGLGYGRLPPAHIAHMQWALEEQLSRVRTEWPTKASRPQSCWMPGCRCAENWGPVPWALPSRNMVLGKS